MLRQLKLTPHRTHLKCSLNYVVLRAWPGPEQPAQRGAARPSSPARPARQLPSTACPARPVESAAAQLLGGAADVAAARCCWRCSGQEWQAWQRGRTGTTCLATSLARPVRREQPDQCSVQLAWSKAVEATVSLGQQVTRRCLTSESQSRWTPRSAPNTHSRGVFDLGE